MYKINSSSVTIYTSSSFLQNEVSNSHIRFTVKWIIPRICICVFACFINENNENAISNRIISSNNHILQVKKQTNINYCSMKLNIPHGFGPPLKYKQANTLIYHIAWCDRTYSNKIIADTYTISQSTIKTKFYGIHTSTTMNMMGPQSIFACTSTPRWIVIQTYRNNSALLRSNCTIKIDSPDWNPFSRACWQVTPSQKIRFFDILNDGTSY